MTIDEAMQVDPGMQDAECWECAEALAVLQPEVRRLREERDMFSAAQEAAELRIVELRARIEQAERHLDAVCVD